MKTHLRNKKSDTAPACSPSGTNRGCFGVSPRDFIENNNGDQCQNCLTIFNKRRELQRAKK